MTWLLTEEDITDEYIIQLSLQPVDTITSVTTTNREHTRTTTNHHSLIVWIVNLDVFLIRVSNLFLICGEWSTLTVSNTHEGYFLSTSLLTELFNQLRDNHQCIVEWSATHLMEGRPWQDIVPCMLNQSHDQHTTGATYPHQFAYAWLMM